MSVRDMRAVRFDRNGGPEVLSIDTVPVPEAAPGEVLVRVLTAGLNPFDSKARGGAGRYGNDAPFPSGTGQDFAGIVDAVGPGATYADGTPASPGDAVLGWADLRSMAEYVVTRTDSLIRKPASIGWELAGALPTPARTALTCLNLLDIGAQDTLMIGAASGGVGGLLAQLAMVRGARVIGTASASNHDYLRSLGVTPVTYGPGLVERVRATGQTITAAVDCHGREVIDTALELGLAPRRAHTIVEHELTRELGLADPGFPQRTPAMLQEVTDAVAAHDLVVPTRVYPMDDVVAAYRELDGGHVRGKLVLRIAQS